MTSYTLRAVLPVNFFFLVVVLVYYNIIRPEECLLTFIRAVNVKLQLASGDVPIVRKGRACSAATRAQQCLMGTNTPVHTVYRCVFWRNRMSLRDCLFI